MIRRTSKTTLVLVLLGQCPMMGSYPVKKNHIVMAGQ